MRKWALYIVIAAAVLGVVISAVITSQHMRIAKEGLMNESFCAISETVNCDIVNASSYSEFMGVPIAWWGLTFYILIIGMSLFAALSKGDARATASIAWLMSIGSILYSAYLAYVSFYILEVVCIECIGMYIVNAMLFIFLFASLKMPIASMPVIVVGYARALLRRPHHLGFSPKVFSHAALVAFVFLVSWVIIANVEAKDQPGSKLNIDEMVKYFYMQSLYSVDVDPEWQAWGNPDAKVTMIEFSEFQCPFCKLAAFSLKPYFQEFKKDMRFYFVNYPLDMQCNDQITHPMHPLACFAAKAGICAGKKGDFWTFHDDIFRNQQKISKDMMLGLAAKRGWDKDEFMACIDSPEVAESLKKQLDIANKIYVNSTPTIILNGRKVKFWRDRDFLREIVRQEIRLAKKGDGGKR